MYDFILDNGHVMIINGVECISLGHGFKGKIVEHEYFGTEKVINDLKKIKGWD